MSRLLPIAETHCLTKRYDSYEYIEVTAENVTRLLKHSSGGEMEMSSPGKQMRASLSQSDVCCGSIAAV